MKRDSSNNSEPVKPTSAHGLFRTLVLGSLLFSCLNAGEPERVKLVRAPDDGIQPQAAVDGQGIVHMIYYKGDARKGDIFYVRQEPGNDAFSKPIKVNTQAGSAIAAGTIRGAQLAVGRNGRVHVVWDGMGEGATPVNLNGKKAAPLLYARLNDAGTAFEPERNVISYAFGLDGGSSVAADAEGNVYAAWHGRAPDSKEGEAGRAIFVARSQDDGKTFAREKPAVAKNTGACACCGMRAFADAQGAVYILYRAATDMTERGETLLVSPRPGAAFEIAYNHPWKATTCPMSSASLSAASHGVLAAWETGDNVFFARVDSKTMQLSPAISPLAGPKRKHPVAVANATGKTLFVWTEGTGWAKGGSLAWQIFDKDGNATSETGRADGVPTWSLVSAIAKKDGTFVIFY